MKINVYVTDAGWEGLKQLAFDTGYVRGIKRDDRPRGMSVFISMLAFRDWTDARPEYMRGTGQWILGTERTGQRCLMLSPGVMAALGHMALKLGIYPYRNQMPVVNGFKKNANPPLLHALGAAPQGGASVAALVGPLLDAIGVGHLTPTAPLARAPADLYQGPSRRYANRERKRRDSRTMM